MNKPPHTCIYRYTNFQMQNAYLMEIELERQRKGLVREDVNYYRKVSKYDLDRFQINWRDLMLEKERQITENARRNKKNMEVQKEAGKSELVINKILKINQQSQARSKFIMESKMKARQNQIELREKIDELKSIDMSSKITPFVLGSNRRVPPSPQIRN